ncbi:MAG: transcription termination factor NusA [Spirochaetes bacterium]|nr:transcription termination factor NusA [Spirochaetota bacterium]MBN2772363.1 transcription termination factor NusA [Spirochaetota bacterium]
MNVNFFEALHQIATEKGISGDELEQIVEASMVSAYKKQFGTTDNMRVVFDRDKKTIAIASLKLVVRKPQNPGEEVGLDVAREVKPDIQIGDSIEMNDDPFKLFGRIATQTAKQVIIQRIKEAEKNIIFVEFKAKEKQLINGFMQRRSNNTIFVDIGHGGVEGILPRREQSPLEFYKEGDRIKALVLNVENKTKGPNIILSRVAPDFIKELFKMEIPEVYDGIVEIKRVVRDPGMRTKVAVTSYERDIDAVGACVGMKGSRIQAIVRELEGEKIDIIEYSTEKRVLAENALTPARINEIYETRDGGLIAVVTSDQYNLAVGRAGHNVRLASQLCGVEVRVKTEEQYRELVESDDSMLMSNQLFSEPVEDETSLTELDLDSRTIELLEKGGIFSVEELVESTIDDIKNIDGIGEKTARRIFEILAEVVDFEDEEDEEDEEE